MKSPRVLVGPDPRWVGRIYKNRGGEDFLGLRAVGENTIAMAASTGSSSHSCQRG